MKIVTIEKSFYKELKKVDAKIMKAFFERHALFLTERENPLLNIHGLTGEYSGFDSFNVTGDYRVIFEETETEIILHKIGTHPELYG